MKKAGTTSPDPRLSDYFRGPMEVNVVPRESAKSSSYARLNTGTMSTGRGPEIYKGQSYAIS